MRFKNIVIWIWLPSNDEAFLMKFQLSVKRLTSITTDYRFIKSRITMQSVPQFCRLTKPPQISTWWSDWCKDCPEFTSPVSWGPLQHFWKCVRYGIRINTFDPKSFDWFSVTKSNSLNFAKFRLIEINRSLKKLILVSLSVILEAFYLKFQFDDKPMIRQPTDLTCLISLHPSAECSTALTTSSSHPNCFHYTLGSVRDHSSRPWGPLHSSTMFTEL